MTMRWAIGVIAILAVTGVARAGELDQAYEEVQQRYRLRIEQAWASETENDDHALAQEMMGVAISGAETDVMRFALADTAVRVMAHCGSSRAGAQAHRAMAQAESIRRYPPALKERRVMEIRDWRLDRLDRDGITGRRHTSAANMAATAKLMFAQAAAKARTDLPDAAGAVEAARRLIRAHELTDLVAMADATAQAVQDAQKARAIITEADAALAAAEAEANPTGIQMARIALAEAVMGVDGNIVAAAKHLAETSDPRAAPLAAVVRFAEGDTVPAGEVFDAVVVLTEWAQKLQGQPRQRVATVAGRLCDYVSANSTDDPTRAALARAFQLRLEQMRGAAPSTPGAPTMAPAALANLHGPSERVGAERVRLTYTFEDEAEYTDWHTRRGEWEWLKGAVVCEDGYGNDESAAALKLRFRADRPLTVSFQGEAARQLGVELAFRPWGLKRTRGGYYVSLATMSRSRDEVGPEGVQVRVFDYTHEDVDDKLASGRQHRMTFETDGEGGCTWTVNGRVVYIHRPAQSAAAQLGGSLEIQLITSSPSKRSPTTFDNVVIEGVPMPSETWRPQE